MSWPYRFLSNLKSNIHKVLKDTISTDGVWKIRRHEKSPRIEVFKVEETGHGDIISQDFLAWRRDPSTIEAAKEAVLRRLHEEPQQNHTNGEIRPF